MPVEYGVESNYAKESRKWEAYPTRFGPPGRPYQYREYPKRLYKFAHESGRGIVEVDAQDAGDADEERNLLSRGFNERERAYADARAEQTEHGKLAAERAWEIEHGRLSDKAAAEVRAAEADHGARHLPSVPETPIRRRGRKVSA